MLFRSLLYALPLVVMLVVGGGLHAATLADVGDTLSHSIADSAVVGVKDCTIDAILVKEELPRGTQIIDNYGTLREARYLLTKVEMDEGTYESTITRRESNLYQIDRSDYYIRTKYCYEYSYSSKVVLKINSRYSYTVGTIIFLD